MLQAYPKYFVALVIAAGTFGVACGEDTVATDAGVDASALDSGGNIDLGSPFDGGESDASTADASTADAGNEIDAVEYTPPTGAATGPGVQPDGPGPDRILLATSSDGVTFTRLERILSDQAATPNMFVLPSGRILVYFTGYAFTGEHDNTGVAVSDDNAETWRYFRVAYTGLTPPPSIGDPDIVRLEDGSFRMYLTHGGPMNTIVIKSATSTDGFNFTYEGIALNTMSQAYKDSLTHRVGDTWVQFVLHSADAQMGRATSADGVTFTMQDTMGYMNGGEQYVLSSWMPMPSGGYRVFAFHGLESASQIRSFTTTDGVTLTPDTTESLRLGSSPLESRVVKDAAVARMANGMYLMAYTTFIPTS